MEGSSENKKGNLIRRDHFNLYLFLRDVFHFNGKELSKTGIAYAATDTSWKKLSLSEFLALYKPATNPITTHTARKITLAEGQVDEFKA